MRPGRTFKLHDGGSALLVVDLQEKLAPAVPRAGEVVATVARLIDEFRRSGLPILATEQYSRGLGSTVPELRERLVPGEIVEKIHFAAPREPTFMAALASIGTQHCVVAGMEAHVCVQQTVLGLLQAGLQVTLLGDAVASRADLNRRVALARMAAGGAGVTTAAEISAVLSPAPSHRTMDPSA